MKNFKNSIKKLMMLFLGVVLINGSYFIGMESLSHQSITTLKLDYISALKKAGEELSIDNKAIIRYIDFYNTLYNFKKFDDLYNYIDRDHNLWQKQILCYELNQFFDVVYYPDESLKCSDEFSDEFLNLVDSFKENINIEYKYEVIYNLLIVMNFMKIKLKEKKYELTDGAFFEISETFPTIELSNALNKTLDQLKQLELKKNLGYNPSIN